MRHFVKRGSKEFELNPERYLVHAELAAHGDGASAASAPASAAAAAVPDATPFSPEAKRTRRVQMAR